MRKLANGRKNHIPASRKNAKVINPIATTSNGLRVFFIGTHYS